MKKEPVPRKSGPKPHRGRSDDQPKTGSAGPGETFEPRAVPEERESEEATRGKPRPVPAPGVPVSHEEYERLKERAKTARKRPVKSAQEDPSEQ